ncbi:hypothetical protein [Peribacillus sp. SCS-155]|uniref:hypothetical protein n=1 Tax=Peribacillus sedimenti TaxID=3115297 RepID=UPI003905BE05
MHQNDAKIHPTIKRCLKHLNILGADDKTKQIVYMYMETLAKEITDDDNGKEGIPES